MCSYGVNRVCSYGVNRVYSYGVYAYSCTPVINIEVIRPLNKVASCGHVPGLLKLFSKNV